MHIAINNCGWQDATTNKWHNQPIVLVARSAFVINKCRWLRLTVNQVSVVLIVSAVAFMQGDQGSNPTDESKVLRRSIAFSARHYFQSF